MDNYEELIDRLEQKVKHMGLPEKHGRSNSISGQGRHTMTNNGYSPSNGKSIHDDINLSEF